MRDSSRNRARLSAPRRTGTALCALLLSTCVVSCAGPGRGAPPPAAPWDPAHPPAALPSRLIVFSWGNVTYVARADGAPPWRRLPTPNADTGLAPGSRRHPFAPDAYSWSPDGRYLLLSDFSTGNVYLYDRRARLLPGWASGDFSVGGATWALDSDQMVYEAFGGALTPHFMGVTTHGRVFPIWPRVPVPPSASEPQQSYGPAFAEDPAQILWLRDQGTWLQPVYWLPKLHLLVYPKSAGRCTYVIPIWMPASCTWLARDTLGGGLTRLPFRVSEPVAVSTGGLVAGVVRGRVTVSRPGGSNGRVLATGYAAAWAPNGSWLYYASSRRLRSLRLRLQTACPSSDRDNCWRSITSLVARQTIWRVRPDGSDRERVTSQVAYGFDHLDVLPGGTVVFDEVQDDMTLWRHRNWPLTRSTVARYGPRIRVERAAPGGRPHVLIRGGSLPAAQP